MAKDFMQDIMPKDEPPRSRRLEISGDEVDVPPRDQESLPERSIRNINVSRPKSMDRILPDRSVDRREVPQIGGGLPRKKGMRISIWLWAVAAILVLALVVLAFFTFRSTAITVIPRAHTIVFDSSKTFTAYPASSAAQGQLTYTVQSFDVDESEAVTSEGLTHVERKASGSVTLYNAYSSAPVKLVKTTRFQTPDGLIFRAPADISIPGMKSGTPGTVQVTIVADQVGDKYNVAASRFTLPGLQGGAMYEKVYALSKTPFSGGFSGDEAKISSDTKAAAITELQSRLREKILERLTEITKGGVTTFPGFTAVSFQEMPPTLTETQGQVKVNLRAHVDVPILSTQEFNKTIGGSVTTDVENSTLTLNPKDSFEAMLVNATSTTLGTEPLTFTLSGTAQLVWGVDANALSQALAGKDQSAFQTVVNGFPGVQEARARIEPFWRQNFPEDPKGIQINVAAPQESPGQ